MLPLLALFMLQSPDTNAVSLKADAGFVNTSGNTDITTVNVGNALEVRSGGWGVVQTFAVIYGRTDGETSTSLWHGSLRGDRRLGARLGLFVLGEFDRNTFSGVSSRYAPSVGLALAVVAGARDKLDLEAGAGYVWQNAVAIGGSREFAAGRGAARYKHLLGEKAEFSQLVEFLPNLKETEDLRINSETAITAPITQGIAMKASYVLHYDGLPEPGFRKTDRILTTGIQVTF